MSGDDGANPFPSFFGAGSMPSFPSFSSFKGHEKGKKSVSASCVDHSKEVEGVDANGGDTVSRKRRRRDGDDERGKSASASRKSRRRSKAGQRDASPSSSPRPRDTDEKDKKKKQQRKKDKKKRQKKKDRRKEAKAKAKAKKDKRRRHADESHSESDSDSDSDSTSLSSASFSASQLTQKSLKSRERALARERKHITEDPRAAASVLRGVVSSGASVRKRSSGGSSTGAIAGPANFLVPAGDPLPRPPWVQTRTGDPNNLLFNSLYRLDVPQYHNAVWLCRGLKPGRAIRVVDGVYTEVDRSQQENRRPRRRYHSSKQVEMEEGREFRRVQIKPVDRGGAVESDPAVVASDFLPLRVATGNDDDEQARGESVEEQLVRRAGEFNAHLREHPDDVVAWLRFVELQDHFAHAMGGGGEMSRRAILEKKIAIFQQALEHDGNEDSEELLLAYLNTCAELWDTENLNQLWNKFLDVHSANVFIWKQYIAFCHSNFAQFSVDMMRNVYGNAMEAIAKARDAEPLDSPARSHLEMGLLSLFVKFCSFECQSGHVERSVGYWQAILEFNWCHSDDFIADDESSSSSSSSSSSDSSSSLFQEFWESEVPRIGERNALGWHRAQAQRSSKGDKVSASSNTNHWFAVAQLGEGEAPNRNVFPIIKHPVDEPMKAEKGDDGSDSEASEQERQHTMAELRSWYDAEQKGDEQCWLPLRLDRTDDVQASVIAQRDPERVVMFDDIEDALIRFRVPAVRYELVCQAVEFFGGSVPPRKRSSHQLNLDRDEERLSWQDEESAEQKSDVTLGSIDPFPCVCRVPRTWPGARDFVDQIYRRIMTECERRRSDEASPPVLLARDWLLSSYAAGLPVDQLARGLLEARRDDWRLLIAFVQCQVKAGDAARAVALLDRAIPAAAAATAGDDERPSAELLALTRCRVAIELDGWRPTEPEHWRRFFRAIHGLCRLMAVEGGVADADPGQLSEAPPSTTDLVRVRRQYEMWLDRCLTTSPLTGSEARDAASEMANRLVDGVVCAAWFHYLASGGANAAFAVLERGLRAVPEQSLWHERLCQAYAELARRHMAEWGSVHSVVRSAARQHTVGYVFPFVDAAPMSPGAFHRLLERLVHWYPANGLFTRLFVRHERDGERVSARVRRFFDQTCPVLRSPSLWIFAVQAELSKGVTNSHRVIALFERALAAKAGGGMGGHGHSRLIIPEVPGHGGDGDGSTSSSLDTVNGARLAPALWRFYMSFLVGQGEFRAALRVFYRAFTAVPFCRALWLSVFEFGLLEHADPAELKRTVDLMAEKELRVHCSFE